MTTSQGIIIGMTIIASDIDKRESLWGLLGNIKGLLIPDKGLKAMITSNKFKRMPVLTYKHLNDLLCLITGAKMLIVG